MKNITIVGCGLVGCLLAISLAREGYNVTVYERDTDPRERPTPSNRSINVTVSARGFRALETVGLAEAVRSKSIPVYGRLIHGRDCSLVFQPYGVNREANYALRRQDLLLTLLQAADEYEQIRFVFNQHCTHVDLENASLRLEDTITGETSHITSDLLFGADGAFSTIRQAMQRKKRFNYSQQYCDLGYREIILPYHAVQQLSWQTTAFHLWPRQQIMLYGFFDIYNELTLSLLLPFSGKISHETINNQVILNQLFQTEFPDLAPLLKSELDRYFAKPVEPMPTIRCYPWVYNGSVALIGDACHAVLPFYGQGANAGFEDCQLLMEQLHRSHGDWTEALHSWQTNRKPDADALADLCIEHGDTLMTTVDDPLYQLRSRIERALQHHFPERTYLYHNVSFTCMSYTDAVHHERAHQELINRLLQVPDIETKLESPEFRVLLEQYVTLEPPLSLKPII